MYLRFVCPEIHWASGVEAGIFIAAYELRDDPSLPEYDYERLAGLLSWFNRHLCRPARFTRGWRGGRRAVCWFRPTATLHLSMAHEMASLLRAHDVPVRMIKTAKVGYVVYEDEHQVVAEPFADTRCESLGVRVMTVAVLETVTFRDAAEILDLVRGFDDCTLPRERWTHAAHLTVALWHLLQYDWPEAVSRVRAGIKRLNEAHGVVTTRERGYHETLTIFWLRHVRAFLERDYNEARPLVPLANELVARADRGLPLAHYTRELLFSWEARLGWVEPDIKPLD